MKQLVTQNLYIEQQIEDVPTFERSNEEDDPVAGKRLRSFSSADDLPRTALEKGSKQPKTNFQETDRGAISKKKTSTTYSYVHKSPLPIEEDEVAPAEDMPSLNITQTTKFELLRSEADPVPVPEIISKRYLKHELQKKTFGLKLITTNPSINETIFSLQRGEIEVTADDIITLDHNNWNKRPRTCVWKPD